MRVKSIKKVTPRTVYAIQTTSETFIADGLAHHNCMSCNYYGGGMHTNVKLNYRKYMVEKYGQEVIDELVVLKNTEKKFSISDYMEMIDDLKDKLVGLDIKKDHNEHI